jgi:hypothetical protein
MAPARRIFKTANAHPSAGGMSTRQGANGPATLIATPSSIKTHEEKRDQEMQQSRKCPHREPR